MCFSVIKKPYKNSFVHINLKDMNLCFIIIIIILISLYISVCPPAIAARDSGPVPEVGLNEQWVTMSPFLTAGAAAVLLIE